jgi:hypothetical protein
MRVAHLLLTLMQVPPGLKELGNLRLLSEVTRRPLSKKRHCRSFAVARILLSHWRFSSVKPNRQVLSLWRKSMVAAQDGRVSLTYWNPLWFCQMMQKQWLSRNAWASGPQGTLRFGSKFSSTIGRGFSGVVLLEQNIGARRH